MQTNTQIPQKWGWVFAFKKKHVLLGCHIVHRTRMAQVKNSWHNKSRCGQSFAFDIMTAGNIFLNIQIRSCTSYDLRRCFCAVFVSKISFGVIFIPSQSSCATMGCVHYPLLLRGVVLFCCCKASKRIFIELHCRIHPNLSIECSHRDFQFLEHIV